MSEPERPESSRWFFINFFVFIALGVSFLFWVGKHTDWLPLLGNMLGLGGIFAWAAFFLGMVKDQRKAQLKDGLDGVLNSGRFTLVLTVAFLGLFVWAGGQGSITLESRDPGQTHYLKLQKTDAKAFELRLPPGMVRRKSFFCRWSPKQVELKVPGLPKNRFSVKPFRSNKVILPQHLYRSVVLFRPDPLFTKFALEGDPLKIEIEHQTEADGPWKPLCKPFDYKGTSIWLGCEGDVAIPPSQLSEWALEVPEGMKGRNQVLTRWSQVAAPAPTYQPEENQTLRITITNTKIPKVLNKRLERVIHLDKKQIKRQFEDYIVFFKIEEKDRPG